MLYPIVTARRVFDDWTDDSEMRVCWYRSEWHLANGIAEIQARPDGVFVDLGNFLASDEEVSAFVGSVRDAWDAVRAIRHGTSLERFPRDHTALKEKEEEDVS